MNGLRRVRSIRRLIAMTCLLVAGSMVLFWWLSGLSWRWIPVVFYLWATIAFAATVRQFWLFASHLLDARQARRLFGDTLRSVIATKDGVSARRNRPVEASS